MTLSADLKKRGFYIIRTFAYKTENGDQNEL